MTKAQAFLSGCIGFVIGVGVGSVAIISVEYWWILCAMGIAAVSLGSVAGVGRPWLIGLVCVLGFCVGGVRIGLVLAQESTLALFVGTKQDFEGVIVVDP
nr:hypothetical protein [Candidatus Doudnabacteria bacterium]